MSVYIQIRYTGKKVSCSCDTTAFYGTKGQCNNSRMHKHDIYSLRGVQGKQFVPGPVC